MATSVLDPNAKTKAIQRLDQFGVPIQENTKPIGIEPPPPINTTTITPKIGMDPSPTIRTGVSNDSGQTVTELDKYGLPITTTSKPISMDAPPPINVASQTPTYEPNIPIAADATPVIRTETNLTPYSMELPTNAAGETAYDLKRQQVEAAVDPEIMRRQEAIRAQLAAQGIDDSGIAMKQARFAEQNVRSLAANRLGEIDIEELNTLESRDRFFAGLNQARELANRGLDLQSTALSLQERGMNQTDARYYAGLAQADAHAAQGFDLQRSALTLQESGMNQADARYYAGLAQAKSLAERGMDQNDIALELQRQGLSDQDSRFYASLAHDKDAQDTALTFGIITAVMTDIMEDIDANDPAYNTMIMNTLRDIQTAAGLNVVGEPNATDASGATDASVALTNVLNRPSPQAILTKISDISTDEISNEDLTDLGFDFNSLEPVDPNGDYNGAIQRNQDKIMDWVAKNYRDQIMTLNNGTLYNAYGQYVPGLIASDYRNREYSKISGGA